MRELEFVLKKIVEIDNKVIRLKQNTQQEIYKKNLEFNEKIKQLDESRIEKAQKEVEQKYDVLIKSAQQEAFSILKQADQKCERMAKKYSDISANLKEEILNDILASY